MRGAPLCSAFFMSASGIIPACAGSTLGRLVRKPPNRDHPRMCGEHISVSGFAPAVMGSSPHVRGAPPMRGHRPPVRGIIPACAGSTQARCAHSAPARDHPRMCGEHAWSMICLYGSPGSSPHVRGALERVAYDDTTAGIIPACAGSTRGIERLRDGAGDHPRMCGEHWRMDATSLCRQGSSPHVRGAHLVCFVDDVPPGIIPACAGSTLRK